MTTSGLKKDSSVCSSRFHASLNLLLGRHFFLKVLNHASRTLPRLPYTNLKKSRTEKKLVTEHAQYRQLTMEIVQYSKC